MDWQEKEKLELSLASKKLNEKVERAGVTRILQAILLFVEQQMASLILFAISVY